MAARNKHESLRRRRPSRQPRHRILVVCEGEVTEPSYIRKLQHEFRNPRVHVGAHGPAGVPVSAVETAIRLREEAEDRARAEHDENLRWDAVWAVIDVDDHPHLERAKQLAKQNHISLAISNPSFELWALWHFVDRHSPIDRVKLRSELKKHLPRYDKELDFVRLHPGYQEAVARARAADRRTGNAGEQNPSSRVYLLTEVMRLT